MKAINIKNTIKGLGVVMALTFGMVLVSSTGVSAQIRGNRNDNNGRYDNNQNVRYDDRNNSRQRIKLAYERGYQDGLRQGLQTSRNGNGVGNNGTYGTNGGYGVYGNSGNVGFGNGNGNRDRDGRAIQQSYQKGFQKGFKEGIKRARSRNNRNNRNNNPIWPF